MNLALVLVARSFRQLFIRFLNLFKRLNFNLTSLKGRLTLTLLPTNQARYPALKTILPCQTKR